MRRNKLIPNATFLGPIHLWDKFRSQTETKIKLKVKWGGKIIVVLKMMEYYELLDTPSGIGAPPFLEVLKKVEESCNIFLSLLIF